MQVDRPRADGAAARQRHLGMAEERPAEGLAPAPRRASPSRVRTGPRGGSGRRRSGIPCRCHRARPTRPWVAHQLRAWPDTPCRRGTSRSTTGWSGQGRAASHSSAARAFLAPENEYFAASRRSAANQEFVHRRPEAERSQAARRARELRQPPPIRRRVGLHRERMHLIGMHFRTEGGVDPLMALDQALALEFGRDGWWRTNVGRPLERDAARTQAGSGRWP